MLRQPAVGDRRHLMLCRRSGSDCGGQWHRAGVFMTLLEASLVIYALSTFMSGRLPYDMTIHSSFLSTSSNEEATSITLKRVIVVTSSSKFNLLSLARLLVIPLSSLVISHLLPWNEL